jgi:ribosomal protein L7/L12
MSLAVVIGIAVVALILGVAIGRARAPTRTVVWREEARAQGDGSRGETDPEIDRLLRGDRLIEAIKRHRELTGSGLKEAKDAMEARRRELS